MDNQISSEVRDWIIVYRSPLQRDKNEFYQCTYQEGEMIMTKKNIKQEVIRVGKAILSYHNITALIQSKPVKTEERRPLTRYETNPPTPEERKYLLRAVTKTWNNAMATPLILNAFCTSLWNIGGERLENMLQLGKQHLTQELHEETIPPFVTLSMSGT